MILKHNNGSSTKKNIPKNNEGRYKPPVLPRLENLDTLSAKNKFEGDDISSKQYLFIFLTL